MRDQATVELRTRARSTQSLLLPTMVEYNLPEVSIDNLPEVSNSMSESFVLIIESAKNSILWTRHELTLAPVVHLLHLLVRSINVVLGVNRYFTVLETVKRNTGGSINTTVESNSTHVGHPPIL
jgi:hypothetical protein